MTLAPLPDTFQYTRDQLHQVAFYAIAPARYRVVGRMGLRATPGGFGTPEFDGKVARVEGGLLVHEQDGNAATQAITTIRAAAGFFGAPYEENWYEGFRDPLPAMDPDRPLEVADEPSRALGDWFAFGFEVLGRLGEQAGPDDDASEIQLWPEHFDPAIEIGDADSGLRASFGASPGDTGHIEPYLYVAPWTEVDRSITYWNDREFNGASLPYSTLLASGDPAATGLDFLLDGYRVMRSD